VVNLCGIDLDIALTNIIGLWYHQQTRVPGENHWPAASHRQTLSHKVIFSTPRHAQDSNWQC
jgi:hypothetical protein